MVHLKGNSIHGMYYLHHDPKMILIKRQLRLKVCFLNEYFLLRFVEFLGLNSILYTICPTTPPLLNDFGDAYHLGGKKQVTNAVRNQIGFRYLTLAMLYHCHFCVFSLPRILLLTMEIFFKVTNLYKCTLSSALQCILTKGIFFGQK